MFALKILKADGSLLGYYKKLDACLKRMQSISDSRGSDYQIRVKGEIPSIPKTYDGSIMSVSDLLTDLA